VGRTRTGDLVSEDGPPVRRVVDETQPREYLSVDRKSFID
jgi:hypothetical protein